MKQVYKIIINYEGETCEIIEHDYARAQETVQRASKLYGRAILRRGFVEEKYEDTALVED